MTLRFYFEKGPKRSSPWRIWAHGEELYVATRNLGHLLKASIHSSGMLNFAFTKEYFRNDPIEPRQLSRHLGSQRLRISEENMQIVFLIQVPLDRMSECEFKLSKMTRLAVPDEAVGTVLVKVIHVPQPKQRAVIESTISGLLGHICAGKYVVAWNLDPGLLLDGFNANKQIEIGDILNDVSTRAVTMGYSADSSSGFFLDTCWPNRNFE